MSLAATGMFIFTPINQFLVTTFKWSFSFQITSMFFLFIIPLSLIFLLPKPQKKKIRKNLQKKNIRCHKKSL